jgi:hypothetical protein
VVLQRDHLSPVLHLLVDPLYRAHDLVLVEQHPAFLLFHPVADPFPYRSDEPQVRWLSLAHLRPKEVKGYRTSKLLVEVVSLVNLIWSNKNLLV